jgi:putative transposase
VEHLHMGAVSYAQSLVSRARKEKATKEWRVLEKQNKLD